MTCDEFKALAGALALGALDAEERAAAEAHLAQAAHDGCREAFVAARRVADALAGGVEAVTPAPGVWAGVEAKLGSPRAAAMAPAATAAPRPPGRERGRPALVPWALAAAAALAFGWSYRMWRATEAELRAARSDAEATVETVATAAMDVQRCREDLGRVRDQLALRDQAVAMLELPATQVVRMDPQAGTGARASLVVNMVERRAMVVGSGLRAPAGQDFELWVIRGQEKIAAGLLRGEGDSLVAEIDPALLDAGIDAFAVTLEPEGGGPAPRGHVVLVAAMPKG